MSLRPLALSALLLAASVLAAQAPSAAQSSHPGIDVYGGAAFTSSNPSPANIGGGGGVDIRLRGQLAAAFELTMVRGTSSIVNNITVTDLLIGPRFGGRISSHSSIRPFADFLAGGQHLSNSSDHHSWYYTTGTGAALAADGGLDIPFTHRLALRAEAGYLYSRFTVAGSPGSVSNNRLRGGAFLVYSF